MQYHKAFLIPALFFTLMFGAACDEDDPVAPQEDHFDAVGVALYRGDTLVASILRGQTSDTLEARVGETGEDFDVRFYDESERIVEAHDDDVTFAWEIEQAGLLEIVQDAGKEGKFEFRMRGLQAGSTRIEFFIEHGGHADFRSGHLPVIVR